MCDTRAIGPILELPRLPMTGVFLDSPCDDGSFPPVDNSLVLCENCGHVQLARFLDPSLFYDEHYAYRTSQSAIGRRANEGFARFVRGLVSNNRVARILEIGCNDLFLYSLLRGLGQEYVGVDPLMDIDGGTAEGLTLVKAMVEDLTGAEEIGGNPDLVVASHTFEHLAHPRSTLESLMELASDDATFVIEVPSFDTQVAHARFDQVFHQHFQYFSVASMCRLIEECGGAYITHQNNRAIWGGTLMVAFRKGGDARAARATQSTQPTREAATVSIDTFRRHMKDTAEVLDVVPRQRLYGFGAAQLLPVLLYHLESGFERFASILDDSPDRVDAYYPHAQTPIASPAAVDLSEATVLVTAVDAARPIVTRLEALQADRVVVPLPVR